MFDDHLKDVTSLQTTLLNASFIQGKIYGIFKNNIKNVIKLYQLINIIEFRNIILLTPLIFITFVISFGQTKIENKKGTVGFATGNYKPNIQESPKKSPAYGDGTKYQNDCYKNFEFTVKNYGYNKDGDFYSWGIKVKNNYSNAAQLYYKLIVGNDVPKYGTLTYYIEPGDTYANDMGTAMALIVHNSSENYRIEVSKVCFEGQDCIKNGYVDCNGKQMGNSVTTTIIKLDSTEYYTSKNNSITSKLNHQTNSINNHQNDDEISNVTPANITFNKNKDAKEFANEFVTLLKNQGFSYQNAEYDGFVGNNFPKYYTFSEFKITMDYKNLGQWPNYTRYISEIRLSNIIDNKTCEKLKKLINCEGNPSFDCTIYCLEKSGIIYMKIK